MIERQPHFRCDGLNIERWQILKDIRGTQVLVAISGFEQMPQDSRDERMQYCEAGWDKALKNLKAYIEGGDLPFPFGF